MPKLNYGPGERGMNVIVTKNPAAASYLDRRRYGVGFIPASKDANIKEAIDKYLAENAKTTKLNLVDLLEYKHGMPRRQAGAYVQKLLSNKNTRGEKVEPFLLAPEQNPAFNPVQYRMAS